MKHQCVRLDTQKNSLFLQPCLSTWTKVLKENLFDIFDKRVCYCNIQREKESLLYVALLFECLFNFSVPSMKFCIVYLMSFWKRITSLNVFDLITLTLCGSSANHNTLVFDNLFWAFSVYRPNAQMDALTSNVWVEVRFKIEVWYFSHVKHR